MSQVRLTGNGETLRVNTAAVPGNKLQYMFVNKSDVPVWLYVVDWCPSDTDRPIVIHPKPTPRVRL